MNVNEVALVVLVVASVLAGLVIPYTYIRCEIKKVLKDDEFKHIGEYIYAKKNKNVLLFLLMCGHTCVTSTLILSIFKIKPIIFYVFAMVFPGLLFLYLLSKYFFPRARGFELVSICGGVTIGLAIMLEWLIAFPVSMACEYTKYKIVASIILIVINVIAVILLYMFYYAYIIAELRQEPLDTREYNNRKRDERGE